MSFLTKDRAEAILKIAQSKSILVVGDVMLDSFVSGSVERSSPEAPVPVLRYQSEERMPGGAANVARNLTSLGAPTALFSLIGKDEEAAQLRELLEKDGVDCSGLLSVKGRMTGTKTRLIAQQQQIVRMDREVISDLSLREQSLLEKPLRQHLSSASAVIVSDYAKGIITNSFLDFLKKECKARGIWISIDPKPTHHMDLSDFSLLKPNRKEAFELAGISDSSHSSHSSAFSKSSQPLEDQALTKAAHRLLRKFHPDILMITLGDQGLLLCQKGKSAIHIPTLAREIFDVSGAGDTAIAAFTLAISAEASPMEAALFSNRAGGIVVGKPGTATVSKSEILKSMQ